MNLHEPACALCKMKMRYYLYVKDSLRLYFTHNSISANFIEAHSILLIQNPSSFIGPVSNV